MRRERAESCRLFPGRLQSFLPSAHCCRSDLPAAVAGAGATPSLTPAPALPSAQGGYGGGGGRGGGGVANGRARGERERDDPSWKAAGASSVLGGHRALCCGARRCCRGRVPTASPLSAAARPHACRARRLPEGGAAGLDAVPHGGRGGLLPQLPEQRDDVSAALAGGRWRLRRRRCARFAPLLPAAGPAGCVLPCSRQQPPVARGHACCAWLRPHAAPHSLQTFTSRPSMQLGPAGVLEKPAAVSSGRLTGRVRYLAALRGSRSVGAVSRPSPTASPQRASRACRTIAAARREPGAEQRQAGSSWCRRSPQIPTLGPG